MSHLDPKTTYEEVFARPQNFPQLVFELVVPFVVDVYTFLDLKADLGPKSKGVGGLAFAVCWGPPGKSAHLYALWVPNDLETSFPKCAYWDETTQMWVLEEFDLSSWISQWCAQNTRLLARGILNVWRASKASAPTKSPDF